MRSPVCSTHEAPLSTNYGANKSSSRLGGHVRKREPGFDAWFFGYDTATMPFSNISPLVRNASIVCVAQSVSCAVLEDVNARLAMKISVWMRPFVDTFVLTAFVGLVKGAPAHCWEPI